MSRIRSLGKDRADDSAFRGGRVPHVGTISNEYYQYYPTIFTRDRMPVHMEGLYRGWSCFMICNGPSIVSNGYDLSKLKLPGVMTYGINNGPKTIRPNFWSCVDDPQRFLKSIWLDPQITKIVPHAHKDKSIFDSDSWDKVLINGKPMLVGECPNVLYFHRNDKFNAERFLYEDTINWGNSEQNGGGRSVMLPVIRLLFILGFRRVFLLGADFDMSESKTYHFDEQRSQGAVKCNLNTYNRMRSEYFPALKPYFEIEGFEVYNCNEHSKLGVFPYMPYEDAINICTCNLGDVKNERTWGMYSKPEEKLKWKNEPPDNKKKHLNTIDKNIIEDVPVNNKVNSKAFPILRGESVRQNKNINQCMPMSRVPEEEEEDDDCMHNPHLNHGVSNYNSNNAIRFNDNCVNENGDEFNDVNLEELDIDKFNVTVFDENGVEKRKGVEPVSVVKPNETTLVSKTYSTGLNNVVKTVNNRPLARGVSNKDFIVHEQNQNTQGVKNEKCESVVVNSNISNQTFPKPIFKPLNRHPKEVGKVAGYVSKMNSNVTIEDNGM